MDRLINIPQLRYRSFGQVDPFYQEGDGLVSGFINVFKRLMPIIKNVFTKASPIVKSIAKNKTVQKTVQELGDHALQSGINATKKAISGENIAEGLKSDLGTAAKIGLQGVENLATSYMSKNRNKNKKNKKHAANSQNLATVKTKKRKKIKERKDLFA